MRPLIADELRPHIPDDWVTVELSHDEITAQVQSSFGRVNISGVIMQMLSERGIRVSTVLDWYGPGAGREIEPPSLQFQHETGIIVHQGPRPSH